ncbi:hypothetical protein EYF80_036698 [Liparis tanakae]|uniref:Uncharacterized protein n=1 Tax=Liparis tanakae TaxID=230148 RepID=A0A4Z2GI41_9TELE|nr:hypothetical protein EYF80_036698 [Liparis tanakae]
MACSRRVAVCRVLLTSLGCAWFRMEVGWKWTFFSRLLENSEVSGSMCTRLGYMPATSAAFTTAQFSEFRFTSRMSLPPRARTKPRAATTTTTTTTHVSVVPTDGAELPQQLRPHAQDHVHGGLRQEVLLAEGPLPAFTAGLLPRLNKHTQVNKRPPFSWGRRFIRASCPAPYLEGPQQGHVVAERAGGEALAVVQRGPLLSRLRRQHEGVPVGQRAGDGQDGVQALEHHGAQHHLAQVGLHGEVGQVVAQVGQVLGLVHGVYRLQGGEWHPQQLWNLELQHVVEPESTEEAEADPRSAAAGSVDQSHDHRIKSRYLPFRCKALALEIHTVFNMDTWLRVSKDFYERNHTRSSLEPPA